MTQGSAIDRQSNNASLFSLVEQINLPENGLGRRLLPLEVHSYFVVSPEWLDQSFEMRFVLVADTGLETVSEPVRYRTHHERLRVRTWGLPQPPAFGNYTLNVELRADGAAEWVRQSVAWPLMWRASVKKPSAVH